MTTSSQRLGARTPAPSQTKARARAIKARVLAKKKAAEKGTQSFKALNINLSKAP